MSLFSCEEMWGGTYLSGGIVEQEGHHVYKLEYVRDVNGTPITYTENNIGRDAIEVDDKGETVWKAWPYERIRFIVDDTGIIEFLWESPYEIIETAVKNTVLKPFADIEAIFSKMMLITHAQPDTNYSLSFDIDRVELGYIRIMEQNNPNTALLVPAWDFFGVSQIKDKRDHNQEAAAIDDQYTSHLTINAIDGSIIDRPKGY